MLPKIVIKRCNLEGIGFVIAFRAGSVYETPKVNGLFHLCEHILLEVGEQEKRLSTKIEQTGGVTNAFTSKDCVAFYAKVPRINFRQALNYIVDYLTLLPSWSILNISEKRFSILKAVLKHEIGLRKADPIKNVFDTWWETTFAPHPLCLSPVGCISSLSRIEREDVERALRLHFTKANTTVVCVGDVQPNVVVKKISEAFADYPEGNVLFPTPMDLDELVPKVTIIDSKGDQVHIALGFMGLKMDDPDLDALQFLGALVGGRRGSRLFQRLRTQRGLGYHVNVFIESYYNGGAFIIHTTCNQKQVLYVTKIIAETLCEIKEGQISSAEVEYVRMYLKGKAALERDDVLTCAVALARRSLYQDHLEVRSEKRWDSINKDDIVTTARRILNPWGLNVVFAGQVSKEEAEESLLQVKEDLARGN